MSTLVRTGITLQATRPVVSVGTPGLAAHNTLSGRSTAAAHPTSAITGLDAALAALQPLDADLTAIAALTTTSYGRGCLALADAPALASYAGITLLATSGITGTLTLAKTGTTARTVTFPDAAITVAGRDLAQSFTALQTFTAGLTVSAGTTALQAVTCTTLSPSGAVNVNFGGADDVALTVYGSPTNNRRAILAANSSVAYVNVSSSVGADTLELRVNGVAKVSISSALATISTATTALQAVTCTTLTASGSGVLGAAALLASERLRVAGGTMGTPGGSDVLLAAGKLSCGDTSATSIQSAGGVTAAGVGKFANGTAAAPGIRLTSEESGLYRVNSTTIGTAVAGVAAMSVGTLTSIARTFCILNTAADDFPAWFSGNSASNFTVFGGVGASGVSTGGQVRAYGNSHATKPNFVEINSGNAVRATFNGSGDLALTSATASTSTTTGALTVAGGVGVAGRVSATEFASGTTKVLGAQGAAVADATDAASVITQLNALLARCRAHGLIA